MARPTFQSLALTVLLLVLYLGLVWRPACCRLDLLRDGGTSIACSSGSTRSRRLAAPISTAARERCRRRPMASLVMLVLAFVLTFYGDAAGCGVWNPSGEPIMQRDRPEDADDKERELIDAGKTDGRASVHAAPGSVRRVDGNPILWREIYHARLWPPAADGQVRRTGSCWR